MSRRRRALLGAALTLGLGVAGAGCFAPPHDIDVKISDGTLRGVADDGVRSWLGIPYAAPPVGDLRWRPPQPPEPWSEARAADEFQDWCTQLDAAGVSARSSEDCLYLNVFRPDDDVEDLPVMVWIHGGGLTFGSGDLPIDTVAGLVEHDVVVVSINYRLGRLGYFAHPALAAEGGGAGPVANFGLLDQVAALQWVQDNITEFGGDPDRVTAFGISAGGASVNYLMSSPQARGLFARGISGSGLGREQPPTWERAAAQGSTLASAAGAPDADAATLRGLDAETVVRWPAYQLRGQIPVLDRTLPMSVADTFAAGRELDIPYIAGSTDLELLDRGFPSVGLEPVSQRRLWVAGHEAEAAAVYGDSTEFDRHFLNDIVFTEPARYLTELHANHAPSYRYRFEIAADRAIATLGGAVHGADYPFVFGWGAGAGDVDDAQELADGVSGCWAAFAKTGTPECDGVEWPEADNGLMEFTNEGPEVRADDPWQARLDLVAAIQAERAATGAS